MGTVFGDSIGFLAKIGLYDVVLPFLLVFTIVFAILDKVKILGTEKNSAGVEYSKKNLNAMVAFVMAFMVVASAQLVSIINKTASQVFILLLLIICFLMLAGSFHKQSPEGFFLNSKDHKFYYNAFMAITFTVIIAIFLNALGWLDLVYSFMVDNWNASYVSAIILLLVIAGFMAWITGDEKKSSSGDEKKS